MNIKKLVRYLIPVSIGLILWFISPPEEIPEQGWRIFSVFIATICGLIAKPLPMAPVTLIGLVVILLTGTLSFSEAFTGFSNEIVWLIVFAYFVARGFMKTGLGNRVGYLFMRAFGKSSIGLGYSLVATDLILAPAIPSNTARSGGVIFPVLDSLSKTFKSYPNDHSQKLIGSFLTLIVFHSTCISSGMFLTSMAANPLIAKLAGDAGFEITWLSWAAYAIVPGLVNLVLLPLILFFFFPPDIKKSPHASDFAHEKLISMGSISKQEWIMLGSFALLVVLWIFGPTIKIIATTTALTGLVILLMTEVLTWDDIKKETAAWETLIWFSVLLMMATQLNAQGVTKWLSLGLVEVVHNLDWKIGFLIIAITYFYSHYFFASILAHVGAMYATFLIVAIGIGTPLPLAAMILGFFSSLIGCLTQYSSGPAAVLFGAGYVPLGTWWKAGFIMSVINILIWLIVGTAWWKLLGLW